LVRGLIKGALIALILSAPSFGEDVLVEASSSLEPYAQSVKVDSGDILRELPKLPGVEVVSLSPSPSPREELFLRGFTPERVYAYYGELPLNGSGIRGNFYFDLSTVPLLIKGVKVIYGPSVLYGSSPGGAVILEPKGFPLKRELNLNFTGGSYNTFEGRAEASFPLGLYGLNLAVDGFSSDGYLRNDYLRKRGVNLQLFRLVGDSSVLRFTFQGWRVKDGLPVLNSPKIPQSNYDDDYPTVETTYFSLGCAPYCRLNLIEREGSNFIDREVQRYGFSIFSQVGDGEVEAHVYFNKASKVEDYYGLFKTPLGVNLSSLKIEGRDDFTYGYRLLYSEGGFKVGSEFQNSGYGEIEKNGSPLAPSNLHALKRGALFGEVEKELLGLRVKGGLRVERWLGKGASGGVELLPAISLFKGRFYGGVGRVYRPPKPEELLWYSKEKPLLEARGMDYSLKAERGWDFEAGFRGKGFSLRVFHYYIKDFIVSNFLAAQEVLALPFPNRIVENLSWVRSSGVEVYGVKHLEDYTFTISYTYQNFSHASSRFTPSQTPSPSTLVPKHKLSASLKRSYLFGSSDWGEVNLRAYSKRRGLTGDVPGFAVFDLRYGVKLKKSANLTLTVSNLFDRKYCFVEGYRMPGRSFTLAFNLKFGER